MCATDAYPRGGRVRVSDHAREVHCRSEQESGGHTVQRAGLTLAVLVLVALSATAIGSQDGRTWSHTQTVARNSGAASNVLAFPSATEPGSLIIAEVDWSEDSDFVSIGQIRRNCYRQDRSPRWNRSRSSQE